LQIQKQYTINPVLDSNFIVALIDKKDKWHEKARSISAELEKVPHAEIILKIAWAYPRIVEFYDTILETVKQYGGRLNFHDALILTTIKELKSMP